MHGRCSPDSLHRRYLMAVGEMSARSLRRLLAATATTVAVAPAGPLVAMGNVALGDLDAEAALLVEDSWQRQGIGLGLATLLAEQALQAGARVLTATVLGTNIAIRRTLAAAGLDPQIVRYDYGNLELHCDLQRWRDRVRLPPFPPERPAHASGQASPQARVTGWTLATASQDPVGFLSARLSSRQRKTRHTDSSHRFPGRHTHHAGLSSGQPAAAAHQGAAPAVRPAFRLRPAVVGGPSQPPIRETLLPSYVDLRQGAAARGSGAPPALRQHRYP